MNEQRLRGAGMVRRYAKEKADREHRAALDAAVDELTRNPRASVSRAAELVGVTRRTIYRALAAAAALAEMEARAGGPPGPAPHDTDREPQPKGKP